MKINPQISWLKKNRSIVVYFDFNYYFFSNQPAAWLSSIFQNRPMCDIPKDFIDYLIGLAILIPENL